jgi:hemerythrin-like domain-containing protein
MNLHSTLKHDHIRLENLFQALNNAVESADQPTIARIWGEFESGLLAHLELEERYLLPAIEALHPSAAEMLIGEHNEIRKRVAELGVVTDLHLLRKDAAEELLELLRSHAAWEDRTLYPWAEHTMSESSQRAALESRASASSVA